MLFPVSKAFPAFRVNTLNCFVDEVPSLLEVGLRKLQAGIYRRFNADIGKPSRKIVGNPPICVNDTISDLLQPFKSGPVERRLVHVYLGVLR